MIEHWSLQLTRTQDLKERGLFLNDALYGFFMGAFALNKSNAENVKAAGPALPHVHGGGHRRRTCHQAVDARTVEGCAGQG
jgi:hypothetical protein